MNNAPTILTNPATFSEQESTYLSLRQKEGRIYEDEAVKVLPVIPETDPLAFEWKVRKRSSEKLIKHLSSKRVPLKILEIGCGNGWLSYKMSNINDSEVTGIDINGIELKQAARVFGKQKNLTFLYADIFQSFPAPKEFDIVVLAAAIQYFPQPEKLINRLLELMTKNGEIHILDSPIYKSDKKSMQAGQRSRDYFKKQGTPLMGQYYFHHNNAFLKKYYFKLINPSLVNRITKRGYFPWVILKKDEK